MSNLPAQAFLFGLGGAPRAAGGAGGLSLAVGPNQTQLPKASAAPGYPQLSSAFPAVNTITLGFYTLPGKWTLHKAERVFGWQIFVSYGLTGASITPKGDPLMEIQFRGEFWAQADYAAFRKIRTLLLTQSVNALPGGGSIGQTITGLSVVNANTGGGVSGPNQQTFASGIIHPELNEMGVKSVVNYEISPAIDRGAGLWEVRANFLEFRLPIPTKKRPKQDIPSAPQAPPIPNSPNSAKIAALNANLQALQAQQSASSLLKP